MHCNMGDTTDQNTSNTPFSNLIVHKQECVCECVPYQKQSCVASGDFHHYLDPAALIITSAPQCCHRCKQMFTKVFHQYCSTIATAVEACVAGNICGLLLMWWVKCRLQVSGIEMHPQTETMEKQYWAGDGDAYKGDYHGGDVALGGSLTYKQGRRSCWCSERSIVDVDNDGVT